MPSFCCTRWLDDGRPLQVVVSVGLLSVNISGDGVVIVSDHHDVQHR